LKRLQKIKVFKSHKKLFTEIRNLQKEVLFLKNNKLQKLYVMILQFDQGLFITLIL